jgi:hypothetical protein
MNTTVPRHLLVIASQCEKMNQLTRLREAASGLCNAFLDPSVGSCVPGLRDNVALLDGRLSASQIEAKVREAITYASRRGAILVLAVLGHGFVPGSDPTLYLMGWDSDEGVRHLAVDVGKLLTEAVDDPGVKGVIGIVDTCTAAAALPSTSKLVAGTRAGQTRLSLLMASVMHQPAYDMNLSCSLAELLETGMAEAGSLLHLAEVVIKLRAMVPAQNPVFAHYDGANSPESLWLARNRYLNLSGSSPGPSGTAELAAALRALYPDREFPARWDARGLDELRRELDEAPLLPERIRVARVLDNLIIAQKTISFLRSFMSATLSTQRLRRALAAPTGPGGSCVTAATDPAMVTEIDALEWVVLTYPRTEISCRPQLTRFVLELAEDAGIDLDSPQLREWAASIDAIVAFNDSLAARQRQHAERRIRLIVSLDYALSGDWPEALGAWLLYDNEFYQHRDFDCTPDQPGAEDALAQAVDWAEDTAEGLGVPFLRVEVAVPVKVLLRWRPEEARYGPRRLGLDYSVVTHWSQRLDPRPAMRRINRNAARQLAKIVDCLDGSRLRWLDCQEVRELSRLDQEFGRGRHAGAIGLLDDPGGNEELFELLLRFTPILLWPQAASLSVEHCHLVGSRWSLLPDEFLDAYRERWSVGEGGLMADLRAVWDDEAWLKFCRELQIRPDIHSRST